MLEGSGKDQGKGRAASITSSDSSFGFIRLFVHYTPQLQWDPLFKHPLLHYISILNAMKTMLILPKCLILTLTAHTHKRVVISNTRKHFFIKHIGTAIQSVECH